ncbi:MAG: sugar transferase [Alphaproteobacteria bacterium]|nr:MAG: sugar transferase [Alphaproteobacteria bacterium]
MFDANTEFTISTAKSIKTTPAWSLYRNFGKRMFDVFFVLAVSPLLVPLVAFLAVIVRLDGGSAFFLHQRIGHQGRKFHCWKLRTMVPNAEERLREHLLNNSQEQAYWQENFKLENDPRVTPIGKLLRKTSLDELPQFWNVLWGDMTVVGPRPVTAEEVALYGPAAHVIQSVKPGVTGLWQVSGRNDVSYAERVAMDMTYVSKISLLGDLGIILRTVLVVIRRTGQ